MQLWSRLKHLSRNLLRKQQVENRLQDEVRAYADNEGDAGLYGEVKRCCQLSRCATRVCLTPCCTTAARDKTHTAIVDV